MEVLRGYTKVGSKLLPIVGGDATGGSYSKDELDTKFEDYLLKDGDTATNLVAYEKTYSGTDTTVDISKGLIQVLSSSNITLPALPTNGAATITLVCTSDDVAWNGTIKWSNGSAPSFKSGKNNVVTFMGVNGSWLGVYVGNF